MQIKNRKQDTYVSSTVCGNTLITNYGDLSRGGFIQHDSNGIVSYQKYSVYNKSSKDIIKNPNACLLVLPLIVSDSKGNVEVTYPREEIVFRVGQILMLPEVLSGILDYHTSFTTNLRQDYEIEQEPYTLVNGERFSTFCSRFSLGTPLGDFTINIPTNLFKVEIGYTPVRGLVEPLRRFNEAFVVEPSQTSTVPDNCFTWTSLAELQETFVKDQKYVVDFRYTLDRKVADEWLKNLLRNGLVSSVFKKEKLSINLHIHPPTIKSTSFLNSPKILEPTVYLKSKVLTKVVFEVKPSLSRSYKEDFSVLIKVDGVILLEDDSIKSPLSFKVKEQKDIETTPYQVVYSLPEHVTQLLATKDSYEITVNITNQNIK